MSKVFVNKKGLETTDDGNQGLTGALVNLKQKNKPIVYASG